MSATSNGAAALRLVLATANKDKAREIRAVIARYRRRADRFA